MESPPFICDLAISVCFAKSMEGTTPIPYVRKVLTKRNIDNANVQMAHINKQSCPWQFRKRSPVFHVLDLEIYQDSPLENRILPTRVGGTDRL